MRRWGCKENKWQRFWKYFQCRWQVRESFFKITTHESSQMVSYVILKINYNTAYIWRAFFFILYTLFVLTFSKIFFLNDASLYNIINWNNLFHILIEQNKMINWSKCSNAVVANNSSPFLTGLLKDFYTLNKNY